MGSWMLALCLCTLGLARAWNVVGVPLMKQDSHMTSIFNNKKLRGGLRVLQEVREYAAATGRLDPKIDGNRNPDHNDNDAHMVDPRYEGLHPTNIPIVDPRIDVLANAPGTGGMGPGAIVLGTVDKILGTEQVEGPGY